MVQEKFLRRMFRVAAVYNISWGAVVVLFPNLLFDIFGLPPINYPFVMAGLGMCIGLYGYGYWVVAGDLRRYPQIVIIGFLGKALGPIGWAWTVMTTGLPLRTMWTNVFNDFIWLRFLSATLSGTGGSRFVSASEDLPPKAEWRRSIRPAQAQALPS